MYILLLILSVLILWAHGYHNQSLLYQWKEMEFSFRDNSDKVNAAKNGYFIPKNAVPFDVQPFLNKNNSLEIILTVPRLRKGIPYTLATVHKTENSSSGFLKPFGNFPQDNRKGTACSAITSAMRVAVTECNEMWVLDSGMEGSNQVCPPQLIKFDLNTGYFRDSYRFDENVYASGFSQLVNIVVNVKDPPPNGSCKHNMVYVSDGDFRGLVVYDSQIKSAWRVENTFMNADPDLGFLYVAGNSFLSMGGIFGMAANKKSLYFHPLASLSEYTVPLDILNNGTLFKDNKKNMHNEFKLLGKRNSACAASTIDSEDNWYCVTLNPIRLIKWNVNTPYNKDNIQELPIYSPDLEFVGSMKVLKNLAGKEEIWMLSNRYQKIASGVQNMTEINFRIVKYANELKDDSAQIFEN